MGLFSSKKRFFKIIQKCSETSDTGVIIVCAKNGEDLKDLIMKKKDVATMEKILTHNCSKCNIIVEDVEKGSVKGAKKIYPYKEI